MLKYLHGPPHQQEDEPDDEPSTSSAISSQQPCNVSEGSGTQPQTTAVTLEETSTSTTESLPSDVVIIYTIIYTLYCCCTIYSKCSLFETCSFIYLLFALSDLLFNIQYIIV